MAEPALRATQDATETRHPRPVSANSGGDLREALDDFLELKEMVAAQEAERALHDQPQMVSRYYDVATRFYEYGWGQSFHFTPRRSGEGLQAALHRQETGVGELLALGPGTKVADIGCGVGGPLVTIAGATGASITGINFNAYQIVDIRDRIEFGNATPNLATTSRQLDLVRSAGFEVLSSCDQALESDPDTPWYRSLQGRDLSLASLARTPVGRWFTARATSLLELLRIAPAGTAEAARILNVAADSLVEAGVAGIFTPSFLIHARKPGGNPISS